MKVFIISEDEKQVDLLKKAFGGHFSKVEVCPLMIPEDAAHEIIDITPKDFVLLDCHLKTETPKHIYSTLLSLNKSFPIIGVGHKAHVNNALPESFYQDHPANAILPMPFELAQFQSTMGLVIKWLERKNAVDSAKEHKQEDFSPIKIKNFYRFSKVPYDVYLQLSETKLLKIIKKDEDFTEGLVQKYVKKGVKCFYVEKSAYDSFLKQNIGDIFKLFKAKRKVEHCFAAQAKAVAYLHDFLRVMGPSDEIFLLVDTLVEDILSTAKLRPGLIELMLSYPMKHRDIPEMSILTAYIAMALLKKMEFDSGFASRRVVFSSLIHNFSLLFDEMMFIFHPQDSALDKYSEQEQEDFFEHPLKAQVLAQAFTKYPDCDSLVDRHHELPQKKGFPASSGDGGHTPLSRAFILADHLTVEIFRVEGPPSQASLRKIFGVLEKRFSMGNYKGLLRGLKTCLEI